MDEQTEKPKKLTWQTQSQRNAQLAEHKKVREQAVIDYNKNVTCKRKLGKYMNNSGIKQMTDTGYMAQENVKGFYSDLVAHTFGKDAPQREGRGTFFETPEELEEWIADYFACVAKHNIVPTISSLACWLKCSREVIKTHSMNPSSPFYEPCKNAIDICHAMLEGGATESKLNSVAYIFQAKNYFGMKDQQEITVGTNQENAQVNSRETLNALREQKQQELNHPKIDMREAEYVEVQNVNLKDV